MSRLFKLLTTEARSSADSLSVSSPSRAPRKDIFFKLVTEWSLKRRRFPVKHDVWITGLDVNPALLGRLCLSELIQHRDVLKAAKLRFFFSLRFLHTRKRARTGPGAAKRKLLFAGGRGTETIRPSSLRCQWLISIRPPVHWLPLLVLTNLSPVLRLRP